MWHKLTQHDMEDKAQLKFNDQVLFLTVLSIKQLFFNQRAAVFFFKAPSSPFCKRRLPTREQRSSEWTVHVIRGDELEQQCAGFMVNRKVTSKGRVKLSLLCVSSNAEQL